VVAYKTVIGHTLVMYDHLRMIEGKGAEMHNPLDPGHLEPYSDRAAPVVDGIHFARHQGRPIDPLHLAGEITIAADAHDMPALPIAGEGAGLPVAPALVEWTLRTTAGTTVVPRRVAADFRQTRPPNADFWNFYASGTHENDYWRLALPPIRRSGRYSFNLTPSSLDTRTLANGTYVLTVETADTCGNVGTLSERITIANQPPLPRLTRLHQLAHSFVR
jgi:hypothetical protein